MKKRGQRELSTWTGFRGQVTATDLVKNYDPSGKSRSYQRLDLSDVHARRALELGATLCLATDAHRLEAIGKTDLAVAQARRAWARKSDILNTKTLPKLHDWLSKRRT